MPCHQHQPRNLAELREITRRHFFSKCGVGVGKIALASLIAGNGRALAEAVAATTQAATQAAAPFNPMAPKKPHFPAKAKRVIYMFQVGAPSQLDLFDHKPSLVKYDGQPIPAEFVKDQRYAFIEKTANLMSSRFEFKKCGQSGMMLSEVLPKLGEVADDICLIR